AHRVDPTDRPGALKSSKNCYGLMASVAGRTGHRAKGVTRRGTQGTQWSRTAHAQFAKRCFEMNRYRGRTDLQGERDLLVGRPAHGVACDLLLSGREPARVDGIGTVLSRDDEASPVGVEMVDERPAAADQP